MKLTSSLDRQRINKKTHFYRRYSLLIVDLFYYIQERTESDGAIESLYTKLTLVMNHRRKVDVCVHRWLLNITAVYGYAVFQEVFSKHG